MEILLSTTQTTELLGNLIYIGSSPKYVYNRDTKQRTEEIEGTIFELASDKLGKTLSIISEDREVNLPPFTPVELSDLRYNPYARAVNSNFAELVERMSCKTVTAVKGKRGIE